MIIPTIPLSPNNPNIVSKKKLNTKKEEFNKKNKTVENYLIKNYVVLLFYCFVQIILKIFFIFKGLIWKIWV